MKEIVLLLFVFIFVANGDSDDEHCQNLGLLSPRPHSVSILEFGAVGDGVTLNTVAFQNAIFYLKSFVDKGGAQLYVPKGRWLTGSIKITSRLTIFLDKDATIIGSQELSSWPTVDPLPSYGQGIEYPNGRYRSLINGQNFTDVIITGDNGTIDGQGSIWWQQFQSHSLNYSLPHLIELVNCENVVISNLTFLNSPASSIHPVYSSNVYIENITIVTSPDLPLTEGIVPDSSFDVCIKGCNISVGHDAIALKSGWDQFGISYAKPVSNVYISKVILQSSYGSGLAFGSEMSGGIFDVDIRHAYVYDSSIGIQFKTARGRGGAVEDVFISNIEMLNTTTAIEFTGHCDRHPDAYPFDPDALPIINRITLRNVTGEGISVAGNFSGIIGDPFTNICLSDVNFSVTSDPLTSWSCSYVSGFSESVFPQPCHNLSMPYSQSQCYSPQILRFHSTQLQSF